MMGTQFALATDRTMMGPLVLRIIWADEVKGELELIITFPANTSREDFDRMRTEIQAAIDQAERRGEQKALMKEETLRRVSPIITVGSANTIGASTGVGVNVTGDIFVDTDVNLVSVWNGMAWDELGDFWSLVAEFITIVMQKGTDDYTLRFPMEERSVSAVGRTIIVNDALVIDAAWTETSKPFVMKAKIENRDGWQYCTMEPASDHQADLD